MKIFLSLIKKRHSLKIKSSDDGSFWELGWALNFSAFTHNVDLENYFNFMELIHEEKC